MSRLPGTSSKSSGQNQDRASGTGDVKLRGEKGDFFNLMSCFRRVRRCEKGEKHAINLTYIFLEFKTVLKKTDMFFQPTPVSGFRFKLIKGHGLRSNT